MSTANTDTGAWNWRLNFFVIFLLIILVKRRCVHQAFTSEVTPLYKGKIAKKPRLQEARLLGIYLRSKQGNL